MAIDKKTGDIEQEFSFQRLCQLLERQPIERQQAFMAWLEKGERKFHSVEEVAEILGVELPTIRDWLRKRKIQGIKLGREWRISSQELERVMTEGTLKINPDKVE